MGSRPPARHRAADPRVHRRRRLRHRPVGARRSRTSPAAPRATCAAGSRRATAARARSSCPSSSRSPPRRARSTRASARRRRASARSRPASRSTALTGAVREAVTNARKHARASQVVVRVESGDDGRTAVTVTDDGVGFDPERAARGSGLGVARSIVGPHAARRRARVAGTAPGRRHMRHARSAHAQGAAREDPRRRRRRLPARARGRRARAGRRPGDRGRRAGRRTAARRSSSPRSSSPTS